MFLSLNWLNDFVEIPKKISHLELGQKMTMHTVEVDDVICESDKFDKVIVGEILEVNPHPNADRLRLALVDIGEEKLNIVCGAPNIEAGQLVPVALIGAVLPNGLEIKESIIRGEKSFGMLCAEDELGLGKDHNGIMILDKKAKKGEQFGKYLKMNDYIYEIDNKSITNRPDLWGHFGMAREISVFLDTKFDDSISKKTITNIKEGQEDLKIKVADADLCERYMAVKINNIIIKESSPLIQKRLISAGLKPINNIVDITNYVMMELGQPMHAFDSRKVNEIKVRRAQKGETITTLDDQEFGLEGGELLIANSDRAIALAGVMGGKNSEIKDDTNSIVLESANFDYVSIRKTSQKFNLRTEASKRFEKYLDPALCEIALVRAVELIKESCPQAKIASKVFDAKNIKTKERIIELDLDWLNSYIGQDVEISKVEKIFEKLGFVIEFKESMIMLVTVPSWRATKDIENKQDLAEEIMRIIGYDNIENKIPLMPIIAPAQDEERIIIRELKNILANRLALSEVYNYSFVGEELLKKLGIDYTNHLKLVNPISKNHTMLRQSLAPNMLENVKLNQVRFSDFSIFEIGDIYLNLPGRFRIDRENDDNLPYQEKRLAILTVNQDIKTAFSINKGILEFLFAEYEQEIKYEKSEICANWCNKIFSAEIILNNKKIGSICTLDKEIAKKLGIKVEVSILELYMEEIFPILKKAKDVFVYNEYEKYPPLIRDLAFVVSSKATFNDIRQEIFDHNEYIKKVELFDVYEGEKIGSNMKSMAFHIIYQADKTLTSKEVDEIQKSLFVKMEERFEAKLRDF